MVEAAYGESLKEGEVEARDKQGEENSGVVHDGGL